MPASRCCGERLRRLAPAGRARGLRVDALLDHPEVPRVQGVGHHPHPALIGGVPQLVDAGDVLVDEVGVPRDAGGPARPGHAVGVARVERPVLEPRPGVAVEVRHQLLVERYQLVRRYQLGELESVGDDHDVVADGLALAEDRADLVVPGLVLLDDLRVAHRDAGGRGEVLQGLVARVDVEGPVGEVHVTVLALGGPPSGGTDRGGRLGCGRGAPAAPGGGQPGRGQPGQPELRASRRR